MPLDFSLINAPQIDALGNYQRGAAFAQQNAQNQMQQMEMINQMQRKNKLSDLLNTSGGNLRSLVPKLAQGGFLTEAAAVQGMIPVQREIPYQMQPEYWKQLRAQKEYEAGLKPEKPVEWRDIQTSKGIMQVHPVTGELRPLGVMPFQKDKGMTPADRLAREKWEFEKTGGKAGAKPLPATALKMQNEAVDAVGSMSSLNADLSSIKSNLETGALDLGVFSNLANKARNYGGLSTEESRNLATFQATLERLRNESLRLNKGVQTEGDAIRSWNEIIANINDPKLVAQRLDEVMKTNQRAIELRKLEVDNIRANYGHDPLDLTSQQSVKPALTKTRGATGDFGGGAKFLGFE